MFARVFCFLLLGCSAAFATISTNADDVKFYYFPNTAQKSEIVYNNLASVPAVLQARPTVILIDGFLSNLTSPMNIHLTNTEVARGGSQQNVIVVDWGSLSGSNILPLTNQIRTGLVYTKVLGNVGPVASRVADFIRMLSTTRNISPSQVHIIGASLGAHIAGAVGNFYKDRYRALIGQVTGLDPAGPFFSLQLDEDKRLDAGDATFVDIYHTNRGTLGDSAHRTGTVNIYVNGGNNQPGCAEKDKGGFAGYCSHSYAWKLYEASLSQNFLACPCSGFACQCSSNCNTCSNGIPIGARIPTSASGPFLLTVTDPFEQFAQ